MNRPIDRLQIKGFKSLKDVDLELGDVNVLIGPNGCGKSNFISYFRLLNAVVNERLKTYVQKAGKASSLLYYGVKTTDVMQTGLKFKENAYGFQLVPTEDERLIFEKEVLYYDGGYDTTPTTIGEGIEESKLKAKYASSGRDSVPGYVYRSVSSWNAYHFHDTGPSAPPKTSCDVNDNEFLRSDAENIAAFLYLMRSKNEDHYSLIRRVVQQVFPQFEDFALRPDPHNEEQIRLEWRETNSDYRFRPHQLSDGTLRFICLATLLLQPNPPTTIIVDEPELGLHPRALGVLAGLVGSASTRCQVIMTTQSVTLLNQFDPEDVIVIERKEEPRDAGEIGESRSESTFTRIRDQKDLSGWLNQYSIGKLWEKNLIGGRP